MSPISNVSITTTYTTKGNPMHMFIGLIYLDDGTWWDRCDDENIAAVNCLRRVLHVSCSNPMILPGNTRYRK